MIVKSVVTGGCGFIGSHLVEHLISQGHEVTVIDNCSTGRLDNLKHLEAEPGLRIEVVDIGKGAEPLKQLFTGAHYVYHLAALADIVPSIENPEGYFAANVQGTLNVLQACRNLNGLKKFVYAASSSCYGIPKEYPTPESSALDPQYPYALTKLMGEQLVLHWGRLYKIPTISTRFFNVYGPRSRTSGTYGAVFGVFLAQKIAGVPYTVVGDGKQSRDFTFVTDVVEAVYKLSQSEIALEIFNVGSGAHYSVNRLVELLGGEKVHIPKRPGEPDCTFADISKIRRAIGWEPKVSLENGVRILLDHIDYWKSAPVWTPDSINAATKTWFQSLGPGWKP